MEETELIIIDPYRDGVYVYINDNVTSIKGNLLNVCEEIYSRIVRPQQLINGKIIYEQIYEVYVNTNGIGIQYKDYLVNMGLKVYEIKYKNVNVVLPTRCDYNSINELKVVKKPTIDISKFMIDF